MRKDVHWSNYLAIAVLFLGSFFLIGISIEIIDWVPYCIGYLYLGYSILAVRRFL